MRAARVDVRGIAQAQLHVDRRGDADDLGQLVIADEAAEAVWSLDIQVERQARSTADGGELRQRQVDGQIERPRTQALEDMDVVAVLHTLEPEARE